MKNRNERKPTPAPTTVRNLTPQQLGAIVGGDDVDIIVIGGVILPNPI